MFQKLFYKFQTWWRNRESRIRRIKASEIVEALRLNPGDVVVDIGAGSGHFVFEFAKAVGPAGKVYAIDTNKYYLELILEKAAKQGLLNIKEIETGSAPVFPLGSIDLFFARAVYHHLTDHINYFKSFKSSLSRQGRVAVIDYDASKMSFLRKHTSHQTPKEKIIREMIEAGYRPLEDLDFLPELNFIIFSVNAN